MIDPQALLINKILLVVQCLTLLALIVYVVKTWHIASATREFAQTSNDTLSEMREQRKQEIAPYVVAYFDVKFGEFWINLIFKNIGKTTARDVKLRFEPCLQNSQGDDFSQSPFVVQGISSLVPGQEIETFFDSAITYFSNDSLPLIYKITIEYKDDNGNNTQTFEQELDLSAFKGIGSVGVKNMHDLVGEVKRIADKLEGR